MARKSRSFDKSQKVQLLEHGKKLISAFEKGVVPEDDPNPFNFGDFGVNLVENYIVRFTEDFLNEESEFTNRKRDGVTLCGEA